MPVVCPSCDVAPPLRTHPGVSCAACSAKLIEVPAGGLPLARVVRIGLTSAEALASEQATPAELRDFGTQLGELATGRGSPPLDAIPDEGLRARGGKHTAANPPSPETARDALRTLASVLPGGAGPALDTHDQAARQLRLRRIAIALSGGLIAIVAIVVVVIALQPTPKSDKRDAKAIPAGKDMIGIEVRSKPRGTITFDGKKVGTTPTTIHVPRSDTPIEVGAELVGHPLTKRVVPDRDQTIDFTYP